MENTLKKRKELGQNWACTLAPQSTSQHSLSSDLHSKSADWHPAWLRPVYPILCFRALHGSVLTLFFAPKKKNGFANKVSQNLHGLLNWGI